MVYVVSIIAPIVNRRLRPTKDHKNIFLSLINKKNNPRVISLNAHPIRTFTVFISQCSFFVSFRKTKVRLLRGPMHRFAMIKPI